MALVSALLISVHYDWSPGPAKIVHVLHNSEHPASVFSILDTGSKQISLVADSLFDLLILKMTPAYTSKKQTKVCTTINSGIIPLGSTSYLHHIASDRIERTAIRARRFRHQAGQRLDEPNIQGHHGRGGVPTVPDRIELLGANARVHAGLYGRSRADQHSGVFHLPGERDASGQQAERHISAHRHGAAVPGAFLQLS